MQVCGIKPIKEDINNPAVNQGTGALELAFNAENNSGVYLCDIYNRFNGFEVILWEGMDNAGDVLHPIELLQWLYNEGQIEHYLRHGEVRLILDDHFIKWSEDKLECYPVPK